VKPPADRIRDLLRQVAIDLDAGRGHPEKPYTLAELLESAADRIDDLERIDRAWRGMHQ
jgi:hypothetical protein